VVGGGTRRFVRCLSSAGGERQPGFKKGDGLRFLHGGAETRIVLKLLKEMCEIQKHRMKSYREEAKAIQKQQSHHIRGGNQVHMPWTRHASAIFVPSRSGEEKLTGGGIAEPATAMQRLFGGHPHARTATEAVCFRRGCASCRR
jgi:hypothetical protein